MSLLLSLLLLGVAAFFLQQALAFQVTCNAGSVGHGRLGEADLSEVLYLASDVYNGRRNDILDRPSMIKPRTLTHRKVQNLRLVG